MKLIYLTFLFVISCTNPESKSRDSLELIIAESNITINQGDLNHMFNVQLFNNIDTSLILYNFKAVESGLLSEEDYMNGDCTAGNALFTLKDNLHLPAVTSIPDEIHNNLITKETLENVLDSLANIFKDRAVIIKGKSSQKFSVSIDFAGFDFSPGEYSMYLIYYTGMNLGNVVSHAKQENDSQMNNVQVFKGWIKSNSVKLTVK